ncbi:MAG TPA: NAD(P)/FAD-dependent oxidoreductase [Polyangiaceae bacterium]|nr:NAD(P)/FAD-dependent oxidoreductase [Polyangiaceae bacterium]
MRYDAIVVGGGVGGAAFACALARDGGRVLVLEREPWFRDRIRGEGIHPWGVAELRELALEGVVESVAETVVFWKTHVGGTSVSARPLAETSRSRAPGLDAHHPELQEALLRAAEDAGATVRRGVRVTGVRRGTPAIVISATESWQGELVVLADGRGSTMARDLGFCVDEEPTPMLVSGMLVSDVRGATNAVSVFFPPSFGAVALHFPLPGGRARLYVAAHERSTEAARFSSAGDVRAFLEACRRLGVSSGHLEGARPSGPLATFQTSSRFTLAPAAEGVVLVGDAAGNVDPALGSGLSLAFRDARVLATVLRREGSRDAALRAYAEMRREYHSALLRVESWTRRILYTPGSDGDALRARCLDRMPALGIDLIGAGPESRSDAATERALFE